MHLIEISPALSFIQAKTLCIESKNNELKVNENEKNSIMYYKEGITKDGIKIYWYNSINDVPREFSIFLAHEFFDALPIHKFQVQKQYINMGISILYMQINFQYLINNNI